MSDLTHSRSPGDVQVAELRLTSRRLASPRRAEKRLRLVEKAPDILRCHEGVFAARGRVVVGLNATSTIEKRREGVTDTAEARLNSDNRVESNQVRSII